MRAYGGLRGIGQEKKRERADLERLRRDAGSQGNKLGEDVGKGGLRGDRGQPALETVALAAGTTEWLRMSAQALRCAKSASAEAAPLCALLWSSANAAGAKRDRKLQVLRAKRVLRRALPG